MRFCAILLSTGEGQNSFCTETSIGFKNTIFCLKKRQDIPNFRFAILHEEMNALKRMKLIRMTTGYFLRRRTTYHSFPGPLHFPIWQLRLWAFRITNSSPRYASLSQIYVGCPPPPPPPNPRAVQPHPQGAFPSRAVWATCGQEPLWLLLWVMEFTARLARVWNASCGASFVDV